MTQSLFRRLRRDERGFMSPMILFLAIALAYMIVWILNTGQVVYDRQRTQNTADAAALLHADWTARSLNVMAMNNVASSQATVIMATSTAYLWTLTELGARSATVAAMLFKYSFQNGWGDPRPVLLTGAPYCPLYGDIPIIGGVLQAACVGYQAFRGYGAAKAAVYVTDATFVKYKPASLITKSSKINAAMNRMNDYLISSFPDRVGKEALNLVRLDDADHLVFHPACQTASGSSCSTSTEGQGGDLPVEKGVVKGGFAYAEMCKAMSDGTQSYSVGPIAFQSRGEFVKRGFPAGKGPLTAGGTDGRHIRDYVNDKSDIDSELPAFYIWYGAVGPGYYTKVPFKEIIDQYRGDEYVGFEVFGHKVDLTSTAIDVGFYLIDKLVGAGVGSLNPFQLPIGDSFLPTDPPTWPRYKDKQTKEENDFTRKFDTIWTAVCGAGGVGGDIAAGLDFLPLVPTMPSPYWLKGRTFPASDLDMFATRKSGDQMTAYRALAVVSRTPRARLQTGRFKDKTPSAYAFAESWVHNYTAFDLYTQDWLSTLVPANLMNNADAVSSTVKKSPASGSYKTLTAALDKGGSDGWKLVNTH